MRKMDKDGLLLCELQGKTFELSIDSLDISSEIFVRRFVNSQTSKLIDSTSILETNIQPKDIIELIEEEYGYSNYGSIKYSKNEMYWIGYLYRYFAFTYELSSLQVYKIVKPKELRSLFLAYHSLSPSQAIERILESKGMMYDDTVETMRQLEILKKIRDKH